MATIQYEKPIGRDFDPARSELAARLAMQGACMVVGPAHSGKTNLLHQTGEIITEVWQEPALLIDGNKAGMSPESIDEAHEAIRAFQKQNGGAGAVFVDHIDGMTEVGKNAKLNQARAGILATIYAMATDRVDQPAICVVSQGRQPEDAEITDHFPRVSQYRFDGAVRHVLEGVDPGVARAAVSPTLKTSEIRHWGSPETSPDDEADAGYDPEVWARLALQTRLVREVPH